MYKPSRIHVVVDALLKLLYVTQPIGAPNQTTNVSFFYIELEWLNDVKEFLRRGQIGACYWYNKSRDWLREQNLLH